MQKTVTPKQPPRFKRRAMLIAAPSGRIQFADPAARQWLRQFFGRPTKAGALPRKVVRWISEVSTAKKRHSLVAHRAKAQLFVRRERSYTDDSYVLLLELIRGKRSERSRRHRELTPRENEVLFWLQHGKSNAEIGVILGIAAATVGKHLERIYPKLGVDNRTAASHWHLQAHR
jgi:DNA-binding CsgD family transcriptional regulator